MSRTFPAMQEKKKLPRPVGPVQNVAGRNGFEAWRQLLSQYQLRTRARSISNVVSFDEFSSIQQISDNHRADSSKI